MRSQSTPERTVLRHASIWAVGCALVLMAAWVLLPASPLSAVLLLLLNSLAVVGLLLGLRHHRPPARSAWLVLVAAQVCSVGAFAYWYLLPTITGEVLPVPSPADAFFFALYAGNCAAVALLIGRERAGGDRETLLDVLIVTVSLATLSWVFLMQPYAADADLTLTMKLVSLAYPAMDLVLVVLTLRLAFSGSKRTPAKALLLGFACLQLAADTVYGLLVLMGTWSFSNPTILLWMAAFACLAAAALHPSMVQLGTPLPDGQHWDGRARRAVVIGAALVLPVVLTVRLIQGSPDDLLVITCASLVVCLLALVRGHQAGDGGAVKGDRVALVRLTAGFVVCALLPLILLAESSIRLSGAAVERDAEDRVKATSAASAELVRLEMEGLGQLVTAYAQRELLSTAMGDGSAATVDSKSVQRHLAQLKVADQGIAATFVADPEGRLRGTVPESREILGDDFSYRDWYQGALRTAGTAAYLSEAYQSKITGVQLVVAVAAVIRRPDGKIVGILVALYDLSTIQGLADELSGAQGVSLRITDQRGVLIAGDAVAPELTDATNEAGIAAALRGKPGIDTTIDADSNEEVLSAYAPIRALGWTVTTQVPTAVAYASLVRLRATVLAIAILLGQVMLVGLVLGARAQRQRREAERKLTEREEVNRGILEAAADGFVAIDATGAVTAWSPQSELLFGWTAQEACSASIADLIVPPDLRDELTADIARDGLTGVSAMLGQRIELSARHRDGHEFPVEMVTWQSSVGGEISYNAFIHDISERKQHEAQLAAARDEALEASRAKTEFLAVMSHELRTPMNGVMGMTSLLLATDMSPQQRDYAETVRTSADNLLNLLNDVLDLAKVEANRLELEILDFDLHPVVRDVVHLLKGGAKMKGVALEASIDDDVRLALRGDPGRLRQVLLNLVGNALKFTVTGSVHVRVLNDPSAGEACGDPDRVCLRFEVTDTGIGIEPEKRERLFEAFSQADSSTTRRYGGTGLGLAISTSLVALLGGEIGVDSEVGVGSTFWFTASFLIGTPVAPVEVAADSSSAPSVIHPGLVLVVDDNATNQKIAVHMLETLGHRADVAASGIEAVDACARMPYDLVLMDCRMPLMDGFEATRTIRAVEGAARRTPIVAMTASAMLADRERCLEAGMDDYLSKPVRLADVSIKVARWIRQNREPDEPLDAANRAEDGTEQHPPVLDEAVIADLFSLGPHVMRELLPVFVLDTNERLADVRKAVFGGDAEAVSSASHALRGSSANMGAQRVASVCRRLEDAARLGRLENAPRELLVLEAEVALMLEAVSNRS